jgi:hypothetical protein
MYTQNDSNAHNGSSSSNNKHDKEKQEYHPTSALRE